MNTDFVLVKFGFDAKHCSVKPLLTGLINSTWVLKDEKKGDDFILQKINKSVFQYPGDIAFNIEVISDYLKKNHPDYLFTSPLKTTTDTTICRGEDNEYYRMFPFVKEARTLSALQKTGQAFEAAKQFGKFTSLLSGFDAAKLKITIPGFHNLTLRFQQFEWAIEKSIEGRKKTAQDEITFLLNNRSIVDEYAAILKNSEFKKRVTHHDTKISNMLFNSSEKGLCVIDLDTVMPGYFISDVGDMFRTYLSLFSEEEKDLSKIFVRPEFFEAIAEGYLSEMGSQMTRAEKRHFVYAGEFMIYMQAIRFLSDYLNGDIYYHSKYDGHNLARARNQIALLQSYQSNKESFTKIAGKYF